MDRGFGVYFATAMRKAAKILWKNGKIFRYYVYLLAGLVGRLIPFFGTIFWVADIRLAKIAVDEDDVDLVRAFGGVEKGSSFGTTLLTAAIEILLLLGGILGCGAVAFGLYFLGNLIGTGVVRMIVALAFAAPAVLAAIVYMVITCLYFAPTAYILDSNEHIGATGIMTASVETMRRGGKLTCFLNVFVPACILAVYGGLVYGVAFLLAAVLPHSSTVSIVLPAIWCVIAGLIFIACAPLIIFAANTANMSLFRDISLDPEALGNRTKGVFVKKVRINTLQARGRDSNLEDLFEKAAFAPATGHTVYTPPEEPKPKMEEFVETPQATEPIPPTAEQAEPSVEPTEPPLTEQPAADATVETNTVSEEEA